MGVTSFEQIQTLAARKKPATSTRSNGTLRREPAPAGTGDYATLDVVRWFQHHNLYGRDMGAGKHAVKCPWNDEHSDQRAAEESDTAVWDAENGKWPQFCCLHAHCKTRTIKDVMTRLGDADAFCQSRYERRHPTRPEADTFPAELALEDQCRLRPAAAALTDFRSLATERTYIFLPTGDQWVGTKVNALLPPIPTGEVDEDGKKKYEPASRWLDREASVQQVTWAPGAPQLIEDRLIVEGGWISRRGATVFNLYHPPVLGAGNPETITPWWFLLHQLYPEHAEHFIAWCAHRVQRPGEKINHALVLGGAQGVGKDTLLDPVRHAVGPWNVQEVSPVQLLGRFNPFCKSVILRVSEARDLGELDRYAFYEHMKVYTTSPPEMLRVDEKNRREYSIPNVCGVILTTNHLQGGIYLPPDDRRHYVAWSEAHRDDFAPDFWQKLWTWYECGGRDHVAAYLRTVDISRFNPKAPPPKTDAWHSIVNANRAPEDNELADALAAMRNPPVLSKEMLLSSDLVSLDFKDWLSDRRNARKVAHRLEAAGYRQVRNPAQSDGRWWVGTKNVNLYARHDLPLGDQLALAEHLASTPSTP